MKAMRGRIALQKHLGAKRITSSNDFATALRVRPHAVLITKVPQNNQTNIDATIYGVLINLRHYALPQMRVA